METAPRNCRFLSLVVVELVLADVCKSNICGKAWKRPTLAAASGDAIGVSALPSWKSAEIGLFYEGYWGQSKRGHGKGRNSCAIAHERQRNSSHKELVARHFPLFFRVSRRNYCAIVAIAQLLRHFPWPLLLRPQYPSLDFFTLFSYSPFFRRVRKHLGLGKKTEEKGLLPQISSDLLKPPSLNPAFAALQPMKSFSAVCRLFRVVLHLGLTKLLGAISCCRGVAPKWKCPSWLCSAMTARDVTGFYAFFSARNSGNFLHILGRFPQSIIHKTWKIYKLSKSHSKTLET